MRSTSFLVSVLRPLFSGIAVVLTVIFLVACSTKEKSSPDEDMGFPSPDTSIPHDQTIFDEEVTDNSDADNSDANGFPDPDPSDFDEKESNETSENDDDIFSYDDDEVVPDDFSPCPAATLGAKIGISRLAIGGSMRDEDFAMAPFEIRYQYLAGDVPEGGPCLSCATNCAVRGQSCANAAGGCAWWGCWQWDELPPGRFVRDFIDKTKARNAIPLITYYVWFSVAGDVEAAPEINALQNGEKVRNYLSDFRFLCLVLAEDKTTPILLHLEPDLWGYGHQINSDASLIPVALSSANIPECSGFDDNFVGFAKCLLTIVREMAPHVLVGFHASAWGAGHDALMTTDPTVDLNLHAEQTADYLRSLGADTSDFVVVEMSDRDAGYNGRWWDPTNTVRPHFHQAIDWVRHLGLSLGLAPLWWQVPYGHLGLPNVCNQYEDNRVDYVFDHPDEFAESGSFGVLFGAGAECMTTPATDNGYFLNRAIQWYTSERPLLCGKQ